MVSPVSTNGWVRSMHLSFPTMWGSTNRRIMVQASLGIKTDLISKMTDTQRVGCMAQVVEHLPSKHEALSLPLVLPKKKKKN
jgi:hypothetical protein